MDLVVLRQAERQPVRVQRGGWPAWPAAVAAAEFAAAAGRTVAAVRAGSSRHWLRASWPCGQNNHAPATTSRHNTIKILDAIS